MNVSRFVIPEAVNGPGAGQNSSKVTRLARILLLESVYKVGNKRRYGIQENFSPWCVSSPHANIPQIINFVHEIFSRFVFCEHTQPRSQGPLSTSRKYPGYGWSRVC